jgi:hypothetical protein
VSLAEGDDKAALAVLRQSWITWCELEAPYEAARVPVLMALAELGLVVAGAPLAAETPRFSRDHPAL